MAEKTINIINRKAGFNFFISDTYEAGIMLTGTEIKSVREGKANLGDSYCYIKDGELWIKNMHRPVRFGPTTQCRRQLKVRPLQRVRAALGTAAGQRLAGPKPSRRCRSRIHAAGPWD